MGLKEIVMFFPLHINILLPGEEYVFWPPKNARWKTSILPFNEMWSSFTILLHLWKLYFNNFHYVDPPMQ